MLEALKDLLTWLRADLRQRLALEENDAIRADILRRLEQVERILRELPPASAPN
ncbi:MAG TPA: hypothetical protein VFB14_14105 [Bryobacteraceae bacterium]|jgi:ABC-type transport system involved in cytochrome bd biosynthesis fused ATPase/permease subunit|nr:hypothetical protein [Bryobacteraceae bacterium]